MPALASEDPFDSQALRLRIDLGVEALGHLVGGKQAEVSPLGGIGAEGVVQADLVEEHEVTHAGIGPRVGEIVAGRRDKEDLRTLFVEGNLHTHAGAVLDIDLPSREGIDEEIADRVHCHRQ